MRVSGHFQAGYQEWRMPNEPAIRVDTHCYPGYLVPPYYDSLLAKVISSGQDRREAIEGMHSALEKFLVSGLETTIPFHRFIMNNRDFRKGRNPYPLAGRNTLGGVRTA